MKTKHPRMPSRLETTFDLMWRVSKGPALVAEYRFHPDRRWRFDFACPESRVAIEIEGGAWTGGRHTRGAGFIADAEKYMEATLLGWTVIRLPGPMVKIPVVERIVEFAKARKGEA